MRLRLVQVDHAVETTEPIIAQSGKAGREGTRLMVQKSWTAAQRDALLPAGVDLDWVIETTFLLTAADTAVLRLRTVGLDGYAGWLARALHLLARPSP